MSNNYDPDWPSKDEMKEPKHLSFWQFLVGFALMEVVIAALAAFFASGCSSVDPDAAYSIYTNIVVRIQDSPAQGAKVDGASGSGSAEESASSSTATDAKVDSGKGKSPEPSSPSVALDFRYGGFKAKNPQEDSRCQLGSPKITKDKISWKWLTKIPSDWKRQDTKKGPMVIAAAFYWDGSKWIGGKMDFCDESRSSRSAENIHAGYNGWNSSAWNAAKKRGFCVVSADGKWRSNLIED